MERVIEILTQILFLGWPALVVLVVAGALLFRLLRRRNKGGNA